MVVGRSTASYGWRNQILDNMREIIISAFRWLAELLMAGGISAYRWLAGDQLLDGWREIIKVLEVQVVGHLSVQVCERNC